MQDHTPVIRQYLRIKGEYKDCILFFRMGDFYEMFFDDAKVASRILEIALTSREKGEKERIPLCGVPCHAAAPYIAKLIDKGYKVAICEQIGDARGAQGLVEREVTQVITPGMVVDGLGLEEKEHNFLMGIYEGVGGYGMVFLDLSTGDFKGCLIADRQLALGEVLNNRPREAVIPEDWGDPEGVLREAKRELSSLLINSLPSTSFVAAAQEGVLKGLCDELIPETVDDEVRCAARAVISYCHATQRAPVWHIKPLSLYRLQDHLILDESTQRNLELFTCLGGAGKRGTLLAILDETITAMGGRRLREWLTYPLLDCREIEHRLEAVEVLKEGVIARGDLRELLQRVYDIERINARVTLGKAGPRDLVSLKATAEVIPAIKGILAEMGRGLLEEIEKELDGLEDITAWIDAAMVDDPPVSAAEGGVIRDGYNSELDGLREIIREGRGWIAQLEAQERQRTGIASLKVRYNQVFGYYIEVTNPNLSLVPPDYIRKQTLTNAERFITPQLKEYEDKVLGAQERIKALEQELFRQLRERIAREGRRIQRTAEAIATLDALQALAEVADRYGYTRPTVNQSDEIVIVGGRHPVVERMRVLEPFVPNDTLLDCRENQLIILTGPNMAGKSTYIRQVALICLMAQMGAFVPAEKATIGVLDRIFTRVGASDNLARGESTFMVEMRETAQILREATARSLVILDEIGRGTSTYDGLSIAWAVAEYLHDHKGPKTLFATHYHELTELAMTKPRVKNYNVAVSEWNGEIIFLRKIVQGGASRSYGIQVARLAGLPEEVVARAREVLTNLERGELDEEGLPRLAHAKTGERKGGWQLNLFARRDDRIYQELLRVDPNRLTPLEAIELLYRWKGMVEEGVEEA